MLWNGAGEDGIGQVRRTASAGLFSSRPIVLSASNDSETSSGASNEVLTGRLALSADKMLDFG
jgi:hypothetical protein